MERHREYQEQKLFDIKWSLINIIGQTPLVTLIKMCYPYYSKVQYNWNITYMFPAYLLLHIAYDEFLTYWAHRLLHHPSIYDKLHFIHHKSKCVTPFSGFAFHPIDAFLQAVPVFTSCFFIPLPIDLVLAHGIITSTWAISIHDNVNLIPFKGILYAGSHSIHHFSWGVNYNYGKITSVCDRLYGSYCNPEGITGYGYKPTPSFQSLIDKMNSYY
jgi:lathosterol oxidase